MLFLASSLQGIGLGELAPLLACALPVACAAGSSASSPEGVLFAYSHAVQRRTEEQGTGGVRRRHRRWGYHRLGAIANKPRLPSRPNLGLEDGAGGQPEE